MNGSRVFAHLIGVVAIIAGVFGISSAASVSQWDRNSTELWVHQKHVGVSYPTPGVFPDSIRSINTGAVIIKLPDTLAARSELASTVDLADRFEPNITFRLMYKGRSDATTVAAHGLHKAVVFGVMQWDSLKQIIIPSDKYATYADSVSGWWVAEVTIPRGEFYRYARVIAYNWGTSAIDSPRVLMTTARVVQPSGANPSRRNVMYTVTVYKNITIAGGAAARIDSTLIIPDVPWAPRPSFMRARFCASAPNATNADSTYRVTVKMQDRFGGPIYQIGADSTTMFLRYQGAGRDVGQVRFIYDTGNYARIRTKNQRPAVVAGRMNRGCFYLDMMREE